MCEKYKSVVEFNQNVLGIAQRSKVLQPVDEFRLSHKQLTEEANEFLEACEDFDYINAIDAVIDSLIFGFGILYKLGLSEREVDEIFAAVMDANMTKKLGVKAGREGFNAADAVKPVDFVSPETRIMRILQS